MRLVPLRFQLRGNVALGVVILSASVALLTLARSSEASPTKRVSFTTNSLFHSAVELQDGLLNFVRAAMSELPADNNEGAELGAPYCSRRTEALRVPAGSASYDASLSLPKWQPGREAGTQSNGSLRDGRATEEALSADEPSLFTSFGGEAVCKGS